MHFHVQDDCKDNLVFLLVGRETSWLLLPGLVSYTIKCCNTTITNIFLYPQNDKSGLRKPKKIRLSTSHSCNQCSFPQVILNWSDSTATCNTKPRIIWTLKVFVVNICKVTKFYVNLVYIYISHIKFFWHFC